MTSISIKPITIQVQNWTDFAVLSMSEAHFSSELVCEQKWKLYGFYSSPVQNKKKSTLTVF